MFQYLSLISSNIRPKSHITNDTFLSPYTPSFLIASLAFAQELTKGEKVWWGHNFMTKCIWELKVGRGQQYRGMLGLLS